MEELLKPLQSDFLAKYAPVLMSGFLFLIYLLHFFDNRLNDSIVSMLSKSITAILQRESILFLTVTILSFVIGAHIYLYGLKFYSKIFKKVFPDGMSDKDPTHNYWRHFSISISFTLFLIIALEFIYFFLMIDILIRIIFTLFLISHLLTFLMHNDIKIKKKSPEEKTFWNTDWVRNNFYTIDGLKTIIEIQNEKIKDTRK